MLETLFWLFQCSKNPLCTRFSSNFNRFFLNLGYVGFAKAPAKNVIPNSKSGQTQERKLVNNAPQALIIEPSRELADQTYNQIKLFKAHLGMISINI